MQTYIAGPMRRIPHFNFPAFDEAKALLMSQGHEVVSPADLDRAIGFDPWTLPDDYDWSQVPASFSLDAAMERDIQALMEVDAIAMLPGWEQSVGATAEYWLARWRGITVLDAATGAPLNDTNIADEAKRLVYGDRNADYGHPADDFARTALIWSAIIGQPVTAKQVALCMVGVKLSREVNRPKRDNRVDGIGYFLTAQMVEDRDA